MAVLPTSGDVRQAREQTEATVNSTFDVVRSPLLAALGAVDTATRAATAAFSKARVETTELRHRLEPDELRKLAEHYTEAAHNVYTALIERGEEVLDELRRQPRVRNALESVEAGVDTAQERLENAVRDLNATIDDLRSRFARTSRTVGERTARETESVAAAASERVQDAADKVSKATTDAGDEVAATTRGAARTVAERAAPRKPANRRPGDNSTRRS
ncbi:MAG: hypothetical protein ACRDTG_02220 [Pseudonocardiaceae bacterium]